MSKNNLKGRIPENLSLLYELGVLDVSSNNLCGPIPKGTQFSTFNVTSFQKNRCLCGFPLHPCGERKGPMIEDNNNTKSTTMIVQWFNHVDKKMSFIALGMGLGIGFGLVVGMFIMWEKAKCWMLGVFPTRPRPCYGVYRFPT